MPPLNFSITVVVAGAVEDQRAASRLVWPGLLPFQSEVAAVSSSSVGDGKGTGLASTVKICAARADLRLRTNLRLQTACSWYYHSHQRPR